MRQYRYIFTVLLGTWSLVALSLERTILLGPKTIGKAWRDNIVLEPRHFADAKVGDIVSFVWNYAGRYSQQDKYYSDHVGIVCAVDNNYIYTIEGNAGADNDTSTVKYRSYSRTSGAINGYFRPFYSDTEESEEEEMNFKQGDKSDGVLAYKALLLLADDFHIISAKVDNSNSFGKGTYEATIAVQKLFNLEVDGIAGKQTISALSSAVHAKAVTSVKGHNRIIDDLTKNLENMKV